MNKLSRSYEARVLVVPLGSRAAALAEEMGESGIDGIMVLTPNDGAGAPTYDVHPLATRGWTQLDDDTMAAVVGEADIVVLLAADFADVSVHTCYTITARARESGGLIAALVVAYTRGESPERDRAMAVLRECVDMLVDIRTRRLASAFLDVLRGGPREAEFAS